MGKHQNVNKILTLVSLVSWWHYRQ